MQQAIVLTLSLADAPENNLDKIQNFFDHFSIVHPNYTVGANLSRTSGNFQRCKLSIPMLTQRKISFTMESTPESIATIIDQFNFAASLGKCIFEFFFHPQNRTLCIAITADRTVLDFVEKVGTLIG